MEEIERKFLVNNHDFISEAKTHHKIQQAYLQKDPSKSVRIRISDNKAKLTIKGISRHDGLIRSEWEYPIPVYDAEALLKL